MRARVLVGPTLALGLVTGAPVFAQPSGNAIPPPTFASAELRDATSLFLTKRYDEAIAAYSRVLTTDASRPEKARAQSRIGYAWLKKGDNEKAKVAWAAILKDFSDQPLFSVDAALRLGNLTSKDGRPEEALSFFQQAVKLHDGSAETKPFAAEAQTRIGLINLARRTNGKRPIGEAVTAFQSVVNNYPDQTEWVAESRLQLVGLALEYANNLDIPFADATATADAFLKDFPKEDTRTPTARLIRAESLIFQENYTEALEELTRIKTLYKTWPDMVEGTTDYMTALALERSGDREKALFAYQDFLDRNKPCFNAWHQRPAAQFYIGRINGILGRHDEAIAAFQKVKENWPGSNFAKDADDLVVQYSAVAGKGGQG